MSRASASFGTNLRSSAMTFARPALVAALLALAAPASAQEPDERAARLEAENAALRLELRLLRDRMTSIDEKLTQLAGRAPWPGAGARGPDAPPDGQDASVSEDGTMVLVREARAADDAGATSPEELGALLVDVLGGPDAEREVDLARLGAFDPRDPGHPFLVPGPLWQRVRPDEGTDSPTWGELTVVADGLKGALRGARVASLRVTDRAKEAAPPPPPPARPQDLDALMLGIGGRSWSDDEGHSGVQATDVLAGGPAGVAGIQPYDLIQTISCEGAVYPTLDTDQLRRALTAIRGGEVTVGLRRSWNPSLYQEAYFNAGTVTKTVVVTLGGRPASAPAAAAKPAPARPARSLAIEVAGPGGSVSLEVAAVRVNGRWLVASVRTGWFEANARAALEVVLGRWRAVRRSQLHFADQLTAEVLGARLAEAGLQARAAAPAVLELPGYRVSLRVDPSTHDLAVVARPGSSRLPTLVLGPVPGETDLSRNPYRVRAAR